MKKPLLLLFSICLLASPVLSLGIMPSELNINVTPNEYVVVTFFITNTEDHQLNISLSTDLHILFSPSSSFLLGAGSTYNVTAYIFEVTNKEGNIHVDYEEGDEDIPVVIILDDNMPSDDNATVTIFPSPPVSGKFFAMYLDAPLDVAGFLWIHENMYPVEFKNGFANVKTEENIYGDANLWLYGEGFTQSFEIKCGLEGTPRVTIKEPVTIKDIADIQLLIGGEPIPSLDVYLKDPDNIEYQYKTDINGKIYPIVDKTGEWVIGTTFNDETVIKKFSVNYKLLDVTVDKTVYNTGDTVIISIEEQIADITIKKDKIIQVQTTVQNGQFEFVPDESGDYTIEVFTAEKKGTTSFLVNMPTTIRILDSNNMQTTILKENDNYIVQILDENGQLVTGYDQIVTSIGSVFLNGGLGFWKPDTGGTVSLSIEDSGEYIGSMLTVSVESAPSYSWVTYIIVVFVFLFIVLILYYLVKSGKITLPKGKGHRRLPDADKIL